MVKIKNTHSSSIFNNDTIFSYTPNVSITTNSNYNKPVPRNVYFDRTFGHLHKSNKLYLISNNSRYDNNPYSYSYYIVDVFDSF